MSLDYSLPLVLPVRLVGKHDFYKIMKYDTHTQMQGYNLHGTLGRPSKDIKPQYRIHVLCLPTEALVNLGDPCESLFKK